MPKEELKKIVYKGDTKTLLQDGLAKAVEGKTCIEEVLRLVELDDEDAAIVINKSNTTTQEQSDDNETLDF